MKRQKGLLTLLLGAAATMALAACALGTALAAQGPIRVGVLAPAAHIEGKALFQGAELAASEINAAGGVNGRKIKLIKYDNHGSASDSVRAFQRAVNQDHVVAVIGDFISENALAVEPWAARMKIPYIVSGAASTEITHKVHTHYKRFKYVFQMWLNSRLQAQAVCDASHKVLHDELHLNRAIIVSENAAWTKPLDAGYEACLPKAGFKVVGKVVFSPDTHDFSPIFSKIESDHAQVVIAGLSHVGARMTVQWHNDEAPFELAGINAQASDSSFWSATNGATEGVITESAGAPGAKVTPKSEPFTKAFMKRFGTAPAYDAYTTYDALHVLAQAVERAHGTQADALVKALEKTNWVGTTGRVAFYGRKSPYTHGLKYGKHYVPTVTLQWQKGKLVSVWPKRAATGKVELPSYAEPSKG